MAALDWLTKKIRYRAVLKEIKKIEKSKLRILDAGAGDLSFSKILEEMGHSVISCDKENTPIKIDLEKRLPFKDKEFDLVVSLAVVEHLENWKNALEEFKRVGKMVIITTPSIYGKPVLEALAALNLVNKDHIKDHKHYLTKKEIEGAGYKHRYFLFGLNQLATYNIE